MSSGGKIIKHLIAKNGPMTTNSLATHIKAFEKELVSKSHMKRHILSSLEGQGVLHKKVYREASAPKPTWRWQFTDESLIPKYKELKL
ncbi:unnamed protein product [Cunninghamella blakesleeana]